MSRFASFILIISISIGTFTSTACLTNKPPILSPTAATAITNGLTALSSILQSRGVSPAILNTIADAQQAISADVSGATWGAIVRQLLTDLYSQLPANIQNQTVVWASLAALEVILATVGA